MVHFFSKAMIILLGKSTACLPAHAFYCIGAFHIFILILSHKHSKSVWEFYTHYKLLPLKFYYVRYCKGRRQLELNWRIRRAFRGECVSKSHYSILFYLCCSIFDTENIKEHSHKSTLQLVQLKHAFSMLSHVIFQMTLVTRPSWLVARLLWSITYHVT